MERLFCYVVLYWAMRQLQRVVYCVVHAAVFWCFVAAEGNRLEAALSAVLGHLRSVEAQPISHKSSIRKQCSGHVLWLVCLFNVSYMLMYLITCDCSFQWAANSNHRSKQCAVSGRQALCGRDDPWGSSTASFLAHSSIHFLLYNILSLTLCR